MHGLIRPDPSQKCSGPAARTGPKKDVNGGYIGGWVVGFTFRLSAFRRFLQCNQVMSQIFLSSNTKSELLLWLLHDL